MLDVKYSRDHLWVRPEDDSTVVLGITDHAQNELGDVVFVELPELNREVSIDEDFLVVESVKTASDCSAPMSGTIIEVNEELADSPELVNSDPTGTGWMIKMRVDRNEEYEQLLTEDEYQNFVGETD